jgi:hypothetical protein
MGLYAQIYDEVPQNNNKGSTMIRPTASQDTQDSYPYNTTKQMPIK